MLFWPSSIQSTSLVQTAMAISCAADEANLIRHTITAMRIMMAVGAFGEAADDTRGTGPTTLARRLKYEGQDEALTQSFPGTHLSVITEPRSISIVGRSRTSDELYLYARDQKQLQVQKMDIRGKVHNPENKDLAAALCRLCDETPGLQRPKASSCKCLLGPTYLAGGLGTNSSLRKSSPPSWHLGANGILF